MSTLLAMSISASSHTVFLRPTCAAKLVSSIFGVYIVLASFQGSFVALRNGCSAVDQRKSWSNDRLTSSLTGWFLQKYAWKFVSSATHLNSCLRLMQSIPSLAQHFSSPTYSLCRRKASDRHFCWTTLPSPLNHTHRWLHRPPSWWACLITPLGRF